MNILAFLGVWEMVVIGVVAVLIFGRRLPEVGRDVGKGLLEFKKSMKGITEELEETRQATREINDTVRRAGDENEGGDKGQA